MTDPKRWTEEQADATPLERELVLAGQQRRLPMEQKRELWSAIALQCSPLTAAPSAEATASALEGSPAATSALLKGLVVLVTAGGMTGAGYLLLHNPGHEQTPGASDSATVAEAPLIPTAEPTPIVPADAPQDQPLAEPAAPATASAAGESRTTAAAERGLRVSQLHEENLLVLEARRRLRAGDANGALQVLEQARARFPRGVLGQEREALAIEALARSGARDAARQRGSDFLRAYPRSPHAADVRTHAGD